MREEKIRVRLHRIEIRWLRDTIVKHWICSFEWRRNDAQFIFFFYGFYRWQERISLTNVEVFVFEERKPRAEKRVSLKVRYLHYTKVAVSFRKNYTSRTEPSF